jgi:hypothetical protein
LPELDDVVEEEVEELADGVEDGCCNVVVAVVVVALVVLPWLLSAATTENAPASPTAPTTTQRLMRERSARPRSRAVFVGVMTPRVGPGRKRTLSRV